MFAIWFVFNPAGTAQNWIYMQGNYDPNSNTTTLPAFLEQGSGGAFPPHFDSSMLTAVPWGSVQFTFTDCNNGTAQWMSNATSLAAGYADVTIPIQRLTTGQPVCTMSIAHVKDMAQGLTPPAAEGGRASGLAHPVIP